MFFRLPLIPREPPQVCDVQGVDNNITDPCVHSRSRTYGAGDRGTQGQNESSTQSESESESESQIVDESESEHG